MPHADPHKAREYYKAYVAKNKAWIAEKNRRRRLLRGGPLPTQRANTIKHQYSITLEEWEALLESQGRRCAMPDCRTDKPGGRFNQWHTDHDHDTGRVRGLLCAKCNILLGFYERLKRRGPVFEQYVTAGKDS